MSKLEDLMAWQIKVSKLPPHERNFKAIPGRKYEFDFAFPSHKTALEVQGGVWKKGGHSTGTGITRDCEKACLAHVHGWRLLPVTGDQIKSGKAILWLVAVLAEAQHG
jgi:very-short-patch-repair endonuclease